MNTDETKTCVNLEIGKLIFEYEMGTLADADRDRFDEHLMMCDFCCGELDDMRKLAPALREHRQEFAEFLRANGVSLEREETGAAVRHARPRITFLDSLRAALDALLNPRVFAPALAGVAALLLIVTFATADRASKHYLPYLTFEKLPYQAIQGRSAAGPESDEFLSAMEDYSRGAYDQAIPKLKKVTKTSPEQEAAWVYMGVCYYMTRHPGKAITVLQHALRLSDRRLDTQTSWFLVQSYLMKGDKNAAMPLLDSLVLWNREYSEQAADLRLRLKADAP